MHNNLKNLKLRITVELVSVDETMSIEADANPALATIVTKLDDKTLKFVRDTGSGVLVLLTEQLILVACPGCHIDKHGHVVEGSAPETDSELELKLRSLDQEPVNQPPDREQILQDIRPGGRPVKD